MNEKIDFYLSQMTEAAHKARGFVEGMDRAAFLADARTQQAVVMSFVIIGEAATRMMHQYPEFIRGRPDIPWHAIRGMRNRIAHGYSTSSCPSCGPYRRICRR